MKYQSDLLGGTVIAKSRSAAAFPESRSLLCHLLPLLWIHQGPVLLHAIVADSVFGTVDVQKHKARQDTINPLFSWRAILKLEDEVQEKVWLLWP